MPTFVGLDCGGTASRVLAVDENGEALFRGQSGPANLLSTPPDLIERNLRRATQGCPPATAVCGAFAGLVGAPQRGQAETLLQTLFPGAAVRAEPDYAAAHAAAPAGTHLTVIAGTGSLVCGNSEEGTLFKGGGRGYLLGDEGSGFRFGRAALLHFLRTPDERSPGLAEAVASALGSTEESVIIAAVYAAPSPQPLLARLLPAFAADLDAESPYAVRFIAQEHGRLAGVVAALADARFPDSTILRVSLVGGVWNSSPKFAPTFRQALAERMPTREIEVKRLERPPVQGAVLLAKESIDGNRI